MNVLKEIEFALQNGFTEIKQGTEKDGTFYVQGSFGYIATNDDYEAFKIMDLIKKYTSKQDEAVDPLETTIQVGKTYKVKNRVRTVTFVGYTNDHFNGKLESVEYKVKDGSLRFGSREEFEKWMKKA